MVDGSSAAEGPGRAPLERSGARVMFERVSMHREATFVRSAVVEHAQREFRA